MITTTIEGVRYALLQERGEFDPEKLPKVRQSWPGICQVSAHGTVAGGDENIMAALLREVQGELSSTVLDRIVGGEPCKPIARAHRPGEDVFTNVVELPAEVFRSIPRGAFGLRLVSAAKALAIQYASQLPDGKTSGAPDRRVWMFPDEREAVIVALKP